MQITVHPLADLFPPMDGEALADLAASIKINGLRRPITLDPQGALIDGRNRLKACEMAGVEPTFETYDGDVASFIADVNLARRNLSKGQSAMVFALLFPEAGEQGRGKNGEARKALVTWGLNSERVRRARAVLRHSRQLADGVIAGNVSLDAALSEVRAAEEMRQWTAEEMRELRESAPDLAEAVEAERMALHDAVLERHARKIQKHIKSTVSGGLEIGRHFIDVCDDLPGLCEMTGFTVEEAKTFISAARAHDAGAAYDEAGLFEIMVSSAIRRCSLEVAS